MIPCLIAQPHPTKSECERQRSLTSDADLSSDDEMQRREEGSDDEKRLVLKMVLTMLLVLVVPAILMLLFIALNPESFQYGITPRQDF